MTRPDDRTRILDLLAESQAGLSNQRIRTELRMGRERYDEIRSQLIAEGEVEKYVCRGGGIRLTDRGAAAVPVAAPLIAPLDRQAGGEARLYPILVEQLTKEYDESVLAHPFIPASLKRRGKWRNPDVVTIEVVPYRRLQRLDVLVWTYEVKLRDTWSVSSVFEAERQGRFSSGSTLVLEWPDGIVATVEDPSLRDVLDECRHHGVSLATLESAKGVRRLNWLLSYDEARAPIPRELEDWTSLSDALHRATRSSGPRGRACESTT